MKGNFSLREPAAPKDQPYQFLAKMVTLFDTKSFSFYHDPFKKYKLCSTYLIYMQSNFLGFWGWQTAFEWNWMWQHSKKTGGFFGAWQPLLK